MSRFVPFVVLAGGLALVPAVGAQEHPPAPAATHASDHEPGHGAHRHHFSYLVGLSDNGHLDETSFAIGAGYRYSLNDRFAIGPSIDHAFYDHEDTTLLIAALWWRPAARLQLFAGPGVEFVDYDESSHGSAHDTHAAGSASESATQDESKFAFRVGAGYEIHVKGVTVMPMVAADFVDGHTTMVYAVDVGFGF